MGELKREMTRVYTAAAGIFLLLQGTSTLLFRLIPALDEAFPFLLGITQMIPPHSILHIITGLLALGILFSSWSRGAYWFALGFGLFYIALGLIGLFTGQPAYLGMQHFDHPFHILLGGLGLSAAWADVYRQQKKEQVSL
jgi:hypothetical protein